MCNTHSSKELKSRYIIIVGGIYITAEVQVQSGFTLIHFRLLWLMNHCNYSTTPSIINPWYWDMYQTCVYCTASVMGLMFNQAKTVLSAVAYSLVLHAL